VYPDFLNEVEFSLLRKLLEKNPKKRLGYKSVDEIKRHPFFKNINWNKISKR